MSSSSKRIITIDECGKNGADGINGTDGRHGGHGGTGWFGGKAGCDGGRGTDAADPTPGMDAHDNTRIHLSTGTKLKNNQTKQAVIIAEDLLDGSENTTIQIPSEDLEAIVWSAKGGIGGDGANGGSGGNGGDGAKGRDATEWRNGGAGGAGGNGGDGGHGSDGAMGGRGGNVVISVTEFDKYLLTAVHLSASVEACAEMVQGGRGGQPGRHGNGGRGGTGGPGGRGLWVEKSYKDGYGNKVSSKTTYIPGGPAGPNGKPGRTPTVPLTAGCQGGDGSFAISVSNDKVNVGWSQMYPARYHLCLEDFQTQKWGYASQPLSFEFGDTVHVTNIRVKNIGYMPSPSQQRVMIQQVLPNSSDSQFLQPMIDYKAFLPVESPLEPMEVGTTEGELQCFLPIPDMRTVGKDDMERFIWNGLLCLKATQLGPEQPGAMADKAEFQREYEGFQPEGQAAPLDVSFPVENSTGLLGLTSLAAGEGMQMKFVVQNLGSNPLGREADNSQLKRKVGVQFYLHPLSEDYDISPQEVLFKLFLGKGDKRKGITSNLTFNVDAKGRDGILRGSLQEIPLLDTKVGETSVEITPTLKFQKTIEPYSRLALEAEIVLEDLPIVTDKDSSTTTPTKWSVVQRRKLEVVCEPVYRRHKGAEVVLVMSTATKKSIYRSLLHEILERNFHITNTECYPISRYGTVGPNFFIPGKQSVKVRDAFQNKLVIVLNKPFQPVAGPNNCTVHPSDLLPGGCLPSTSGFHPSTRWLFLDVEERSVQDMLTLHRAPGSAGEHFHAMTHKSSSRYFEWLLQELRQRQGQQEPTETIKSEGNQFRRDTIVIKSWLIRNYAWTRERHLKTLTNKARAIQERLTKHDPLYQYCVEYEPAIPPEAAPRRANGQKKEKPSREIGRIHVIRGSCRLDNPAVLAKSATPGESILDSTASIASKSMCFAIALALSPEQRVKAFCQALRHNNDGSQCDVLMALRDTIISQCLMDVANLLDQARSPSVRKKSFSKRSLMGRRTSIFPTLSLLLDSQHHFEELVRETQHSQSLKEIAQAELSDLVAQLECIATSRDLRPIFLLWSVRRKVRSVLAQMLQELKTKWKSLLQEEEVKTKRREIKKSVRTYIRTNRKKYRVRIHQRWRKGLNYLHSTSNTTKYVGPSMHVCRLQECCDGTMDRTSMRFPIPEKMVQSSADGYFVRSQRTQAQAKIEAVQRDVGADRSEFLLPEQRLNHSKLPQSPKKSKLNKKKKMKKGAPTSPRRRQPKRKVNEGDAPASKKSNHEEVNLSQGGSLPLQ